MSKKLVLTFTLFSIAVFLFIIVWVGVRAINTRNDGLQRAEASFVKLQKSVASSYLAGNGFGTDYFSTQARSQFKADPSLKVVVIYTSPNTVQYLYAVERRYVESDSAGQNQFLDHLPNYHYDRLEEVKLTSPLILSGSESANIDAIYTVFGRQEIFAIVRQALIVLLSFLILTAIILVMSPFISQRRPERETADRDGADFEPNGVREPETWSSGQAGHPVDDTEPTFGQARRTGMSGNTGEDDGFFADLEVLTEQSKEEEKPADIPKSQSASNGLYSPHSGLGWQEYLEERLSAELKRAASFDQDLVLILLSVSSLRKESSLYRTLADELKSYFNFKDLCFEYGSSGFAVIVPNIDLDQGIEKLQAFRRRAEEILRESSPGARPEEIAAGLSARNGRLSSGSRIIREADRALAKAERHPGHVVAFRVDPDKYRSYIADQT